MHGSLSLKADTHIFKNLLLRDADRINNRQLLM